MKTSVPHRPKDLPRIPRWPSCRALLFLGFLGGAVVALEGSVTGPFAQNGPELSTVETQRHFRIDNPADLSVADAEAIYKRIVNQMVAGYRLSGSSAARDYRRWRRYNTGPYLSAAHGNRYVSNYANALAGDYSRLNDGASMPPGSKIVKDSFTVTPEGDVYTAPLSIMEKMQPGFNPDSRDWRYTLVMPDGSILGTTMGEASDSVAFCAVCHMTAGDGRDHLFFVPERYRAKLPD